jgi:hypothetical protein
MIPKEHSELIVERLPEAEFVVVPDAGHMVLLEEPDVVSGALTRLLRRVAAQQAADARGGRALRPRRPRP